MKFIILIAIVASVAGQRDSDDFVIHEIYETADLNSTIVAANAVCQININSNVARQHQPLFIRPGTTQFFHPLDRRGIIEMASNQQIELFCSGGFATPGGISGNSVTISCNGGNSATRMVLNGVFHNFHEFSCRSWNTFVAQRRATTQRCFNQGIFVDVGFHVGTRFLQVYSSCHDPRTEENYYTEYSLTPASDGQERNVVRPSWSQGDFFPGKNVDTMHTRNNQRTAIGRIIGTAAAGRMIEQPDSDVFLSRGHMSAMTDFLTANEQRSTFLFINTAPQWQTFNGLNWNSVEISARRLASDRNIFLVSFKLYRVILPCSKIKVLNFFMIKIINYLLFRRSICIGNLHRNFWNHTASR